PGCPPGAPALAGPPRDKIVIVSPAANLSTLRAPLVYRFIYVSSGIRRLPWRFLGMVGSGDTASAGVPLADSRRDRTSFCTPQASKDQVGVIRAAIRGTHRGTGDLPVSRAGYHESY